MASPGWLSGGRNGSKGDESRRNRDQEAKKLVSETRFEDMSSIADKGKGLLELTLRVLSLAREGNLKTPQFQK